MKYWLALFSFPALLAASGPVPLITGAVRDQLGDPIPGAVVSAGRARTQTDADGTFALQAQAGRVRISCDYCETVMAPVDAEGTVVAVVLRYRALAQDAPSEADLHALPYAHAESAISLAPFVVLNDSARTLPGPRVSYYGASRAGGLLVDDGIPSYDIAAGVTAFRALPAYGVQNATLLDQSYAYRYGDMAAGGTFLTRTDVPSGADASVLVGNLRAGALAQTPGTSSYTASFSSDDTESRQRAEAWTQTSNGNETLRAQLLAARDDIATEYKGGAISSLSALRMHYETTRAARTYADVVADRSGYAATSASGFPIDGEWSDVSFSAGISYPARLSAFADAGLRTSTAYYDATGAGVPRVAGSIQQMHVSVGAQSQSGPLTWRAGIGAFDVAYDGGKNGNATPLFAQMLVPSLFVSYDASPQWSVSAQAGGSFRLPTLTEAYVFPRTGNDLVFDRFASQSASITYSELRRIRISITGLHDTVSGLDNGPVNAAGGSVVWQIAPYISLRAWTLHLDDASVPNGQVFRFGAAPEPATPASLWATYGNPSGLRIDAIWRRDLLDYRPNSHFDASASGPLSGDIRWFAGGEEITGTRYFSVGLRYSHL